MKYPVGTRVRVVDCYSGGNFQVGEIVHIDHIGFEDDLDCYGAVSPHDNVQNRNLTRYKFKPEE